MDLQQINPAHLDNKGVRNLDVEGPVLSRAVGEFIFDGL